MGVRPCGNRGDGVRLEVEGRAADRWRWGCFYTCDGERVIMIYIDLNAASGLFLHVSS